MTQAWERSRKVVRRLGIVHFVLLIASVCFVAPDHARGQECAGVLTSTTGAVVWTPQWCDEFNATTAGPPSTTTWSFDLGNNNGWGNNELEVYCGPPGYPNNPPQCPTTFDPATSNAYVNGLGHLVIQAINSAGTWTSARLNTNISPTPTTFQFGRIEASEKLPVGAGLWPAFWALGSNFATVAWPTCGEMDFMENVLGPQGPAPTLIRSTIHGGNSPTNCYCGANGIAKDFTFPSGDVTRFHAYGAIWSPNMVQFYVDNPNNVFFIVTASDIPAGFQWAFNHPFIAITNLAVGGSYVGSPNTTTPNPAVMQVDYVRYYQAAAVPAPKLATQSNITVTAGDTTGNTNEISLSSSSGTGRVYLQCSTTAPKTACSINTGTTLNPNVADFSASSTGTATVIVATEARTSVLPPFAFNPKMRLWTPIAAAVLVTLLLFFTRLHGRGGMRRWTRALALAGLLMAGVIAVSCGSTSTIGTPKGVYSVTVNAYTETGSGSSPDATLSFTLTVN